MVKTVTTASVLERDIETIEANGHTSVKQRSLGDERRWARGAVVARVRQVGRRRWKKEFGYHRQARAENAIFRYKRLLGGRLRARDCDSQRVEVRLSCSVLNRMTELGAAQSYSIGR